jgi:serine/threonine protein kinase
MTGTGSISPDDIRALLGARFEIGVELGRGGQGVVFRALRTLLPDGREADDDCALKVHLSQGHDERVAREIAVMERIRHPCLANLLEHGVVESPDRHSSYIAWEYIEGKPLDRCIRESPVSPRTAALIGRDVANAIVHIWDQRVVHRDIKPSNIMMRAGDEGAVLIDLGAARHLDESTLTAVGWTLGTEGYMSPEQSRGESRLTCFSDVFSLAVSLVEALTGRHPTGRRQDILSATRLRGASLLPASPALLVDAIDRMLEHRPAFRPQPRALAELFDRLLTQLPN